MSVGVVNLNVYIKSQVIICNEKRYVQTDYILYENSTYVPISFQLIFAVHTVYNNLPEYGYIGTNEFAVGNILHEKVARFRPA